MRLRRFEAFRQGLRELGYVEGQSIVLEPRWAEGQYARYPALAADLVRLKAAVIVVVGGTGTKAAKEVTRTVPIVMSLVIDPVGSGLVPSLAHPGGNVTGTSIMAPDLVGKQLGVLKEMVPKVSRVAVLANPGHAGEQLELRETEAVARALNVRLQYLTVRAPDDFNDAFRAVARERAEGIVAFPDALMMAHRKEVAEFSAKSRIASISGWSEFAEAGGLMTYGPNLRDSWRRLAVFVDKILKGTKPADLPVEQPTKFELVINLKAAKQIGLTIPPNVLVRADKVIK